MVILIARAENWWQAQPERRRSWLFAAAVFAFYALVTVIVTWPVTIRLRAGLAGDAGGDQLETMWILWHTREAMLAGHNPFVIDTLAYPGVYLAPVRAAQWVYPIASLPLTLLFSPIVAYNLTFLLGYMLTGYCGYLLCREVTAHRGAALLGGLAIMLWPLRVTHGLAGHMALANQSLTLLYMMMLLRTLRLPLPRRAAITGVLLALALMMHATLLPYVLGPWTVLVVMIHLWQAAPRFGGWPLWRALGIVAGVAFVLCLPFYLPTLRLLAGPTGQVMEGGNLLFSVEPLSYLSPSPENPLLRALGMVPPYAPTILAANRQEIMAYLGLSVIVLAGVALARRWRDGLPWLAVALVAMLFALGPYLLWLRQPLVYRLEATESFFTLPYATLTGTPFYAIVRTPGRFNLLTGITLGVLVAFGARELLAWKPGSRAVSAVAVLGLVMALEYTVLWPFPSFAVEPAGAVSRYLAGQEPGGAVLNLPLGLRSQWPSSMAQQINHGWPLVEGYVDRALPQPPGRIALLESVTTPPEAVGDILLPLDPAEGAALLASERIRYVLVHRGSIGDEAGRRAYLTGLLGGYTVEDENNVLFAVPEAGAVSGPLLALDGFAGKSAEGIGWGLVENWDGVPSRWLSQRASVVIYSPVAQHRMLSFRAFAGDTPRRVAVTLNEQPVTALVIGAAATYTLPDLPLRAGYNLLTLDGGPECWTVGGDARCRVNTTLIGAPVGTDACWLADPTPPRCLSVLVQDVRLAPTDDEAYRRLDVPLGDAIRFAGYWQDQVTIRPGEAFTLTLAWEATGASPENYNYFVHLYDPETRTLLAQADGAPLREAYLTTQWQPGETITQTVTLTVPEDAPAGRYDLLTGLYSLSSFQRLFVMSARLYAPDGAVYLNTLTVEEAD
ncbi:MAG: hypothetical protein IT326_10060 [Anaerolineae bacterium]|nr:hypothetical protein [Anaerolineae bacterium]